MNITNKEEYLAYRSEWKAKYKELTQIIRERKWMWKVYSRCANKTRTQIGPDIGQDWYLNFRRTMEYFLSFEEKYMKLRKKYEGDRILLEIRRKEARKMNEELKLVKAEAKKRWLESKNNR